MRFLISVYKFERKREIRKSKHKEKWIENGNGKVLCPITNVHESNLDNNYSNLHCEKQNSSENDDNE